MYDQSKQSELIRFARIDPGSTVIDVYPGDGDWTRLFSDAVGPEGRVFSFVPAEVAHFKNDPLGLMRTLAKEPGRENVEAVSADLVAMPEVTQPADVLWLHLFYHDLHTALIQDKGATAAGFVLDAVSTLLANEDDQHAIKVFDPSIKGQTDRFAYRFVKP